MVKKRVLFAILTICLVVALVPFGIYNIAYGASEEQQAHENCAAESERQQVSSISELKAALAKSGDADILLNAANNSTWYMNSSMSVASGTKHITVPDGVTVTLKVNNNITPFTIPNGSALILGDGSIVYEGDSLEEAAQKGDYEIKRLGGTLVIDGGAVWAKSYAFNGSNFTGDKNGLKTLFYDMSDKKEYIYVNNGLICSESLFMNSGRLDLWGGVTIQNTAKINNYGSAIYSQEGSAVNLFDGVIKNCVAAGNEDAGQGAVFVGTNPGSGSSGSWKLKPTNQVASLKMYGGSVTDNAASGSSVVDGGGIALNQASMDFYGGSVSYNHAGTQITGGGAGDGGGIMVRCGSYLDLWNGEISHNYAGGYGGGVVAWNGDVNIHGGQISENRGVYGGGVGITAYNGNAASYVNMYGGTIIGNEAILDNNSSGGYGGGICAGSSHFGLGAHLNLSGGIIKQNKAVNGGGAAIYASGDKTDGFTKSNTNVTMSGDFSLSGNSANYNGNGMYITNISTGNKQHLVTLAGNAQINTDNPVYLNNVCIGQVPIYVSDKLTTKGSAGIFEFSDAFWNGTAANYQSATDGFDIVKFADGLDVQENKIALESTSWYMRAGITDADKNMLELMRFTTESQYTVRNGTPVKQGGREYYKLYSGLDDAFEDAQDGDTLYIFYNTTVDKSAVLSDNKKVTLLAESTSSAANDGMMAENGDYKFTSGLGYKRMSGTFLLYQNGSLTASEYKYNVRNDYTITLSAALSLGEESKTGYDAEEAAIIVDAGSSLEVGQVSADGMGAGALTFDGNLSYPKEGPMFQVSGSVVLHNGVTVEKTSNYSLAHPGAVEILGGGDFTINDGVIIRNNVSPIGGAVTVAANGKFTMNGGSVENNIGAMPRYGFSVASGAKYTGYDVSYWGQAKYYYGSGGVYNMGEFTMNGGSVTGNRGEHGGLTNVRTGSMNLVSGVISNNHALTGTGEGTDYDLSVIGYTEGALPAANKASVGSGNGGGLYLNGVVGSQITIGSGVKITDNTAVGSGGGISVGMGYNLLNVINGYKAVGGGALETVVTSNGSKTVTAMVPSYGMNMGGYGKNGIAVDVKSGASVTGNTAGIFGGGVYGAGIGDVINIENGVVLSQNEAIAGGGLAALRGAEITFANEITENTAEFGGGVYVGGHFADESVTKVTAKGRITANGATHGGGAFVDCFDKADDIKADSRPLPQDPGYYDDLSLNDVEGTNGLLVLDGAFVNNNRLEAKEANKTGRGVGIYNRGDIQLSAASGEQPTVSYNDRTFLEKGHVITLAESYNIAESGQSSSNKLTVESRMTTNGTPIFRGATPQQALDFINSNLVTHFTHTIVRSATDTNVIEINAAWVRYYTAMPDDGGVVSEFSYAPGANDVYVLNFNAAGQKNGATIEGFTLPEGKNLNYWAAAAQDADGSWHYVMADGNLTDDPESAVKYYPGDSIDMRADKALVAVYIAADYYVSFTDHEQNGKQNSVPTTEQFGSLYVDNASYSSRPQDQCYFFSSGSQLVIKPTPVADGDRIGVLKKLNVYHEIPAEQYKEEDGYKTSTSMGVTTYWKLDFAAVMDKESYTVNNQSIEFYSTGKISEIIKSAGVEADVTEDGRGVTYQAPSANIWVETEFDRAFVKMDITHMNTESTESSDAFVGYYDTLQDAYLAMIGRHMNHADENCVTAMKLLVANSDDKGEEGTNGVVYKYGKDSYNADTDYIPGYIFSDLDYTLDLNNFTLDTQAADGLTITDSHLFVKNGVVRSSVKSMAPYTAVNSTIATENLKLMSPNSNYSAMLTENSFFSVGNNCDLGNLYFDDTSRVYIPETFSQKGSSTVATLCLNQWNYELGERSLIKMYDGVTTAEADNIRTKFALAGPAGMETADSQNWFIGNDGYLYKKIDGISASLDETLCGSETCVLKKTWDYKDDAHELYDPDGSMGTGNGNAFISSKNYPVTSDYTITHGYNSNEHKVDFSASIYDTKGNIVTGEHLVGTVEFTVSLVNPKGTLFERIYAGHSVLNNNGVTTHIYAGLPTLNATGVTSENDSYYISAEWSGKGQYSPQYASYWNNKYTKGGQDIAENSVYGGVRLSVAPKPISDSSVTITDLSPKSAHYIGHEGAAKGYVASPYRTNVYDNNINYTLQISSECQAVYRKLTTEANGSFAGEADGVKYYYADDIYYTKNGQLLTDEENAGFSVEDMNVASAGIYSTEILALSDNYSGYSGWKGCLFTIMPYSDALTIDVPNVVVVGEAASAEKYKAKIKAVFEDYEPKIYDRYGNQLDLGTGAIEFIPISSGAALGSDGLPVHEGLYNVKVTAKGHDKGSLILDGVESKTDANYSENAAGYYAVLITSSQLNLFMIPDEVNVPWTGKAYNDSSVKEYDGDSAGNYQVWQVAVDSSGNPLGENGSVIDVKDIPTKGKDRVRFNKEDYRLEIGTTYHVPSNAGTYTMFVSDNAGRYRGIGYLNIGTATIRDIELNPESSIYDGHSQIPGMTVHNQDGNVLSHTVDFNIYATDANDNVTNIDIVNAGSYKYWANGAGNYINSRVSKNFTVIPKNLDNTDVTAENGLSRVMLNAENQMIDNGVEIVHSEKLYYNGMVLTADTDYWVDDSDVKQKPGIYEIKIHGKGNYTGTISYLLHVYANEDSGVLNILNDSTSYIYNGGAFDSYGWIYDCNIVYNKAGQTSKFLDVNRCKVEVFKDIECTKQVAADDVLNVGTYFVRFEPDDDYAAELGIDVNEFGIGLFTLERCPVTVTVDNASKVYGTNDPESAYVSYSTNLAASAGSEVMDGFYVADHDKISGSFTRTKGESVTNNGYGYLLSTFTAGDNYRITVSDKTKFRIVAKDINDPDIAVDYDKTMPYTGYEQYAINSVVYNADLGTYNLAAGSNFTLSYQKWIEGTHPEGEICTPDDGCADGYWADTAVAPADVGWYHVIIDCDGTIAAYKNYKGKRVLTTQITAEGGALDVSMMGNDTVTYKGAAYKPAVSIERGGFTLPNGSYTLSYHFVSADGSADSTGAFVSGETEFTEAGTYTIYALGKNNYIGSSGSVEFVIEQKDLAENDNAGGTTPVGITLTEDRFVYDGTPKVADVKASYSGAAENGLQTPAELVNDRDFTLAYRNHMNAGTAEVTVSGKGNYKGSRTLEYTVDKKELDVLVLNAAKIYGDNDPAYSYVLRVPGSSLGIDVGAMTGKISREPGEDVNDIGYALKIGSLSVGSNYNLILDAEQYLKITPKQIADENNEPADKISVSMPSVVVGNNNLPSVELTYWAAIGTKVLQKDTDFTVKYFNPDGTEITDGKVPSAAGSDYYVEITAQGKNYTGTIKRSFTVMDESTYLSVTADPNQAFYAGTKGNTITLNAKLANNDVTVNTTFEVTGITTSGRTIAPIVDSSNPAKPTFTPISAGTYMVIAKGVINDESGQRVTYGSTTVIIHPKSVQDDDVIGKTLGEYGYTGVGVTIPEDELNTLLTFNGDQLIDNTDFTVSYADNVNPGQNTATLTVHGQGNYTGSRSFPFSIGETRYRVSYNGNGNTSGTEPYDANYYKNGSMALAASQGDLSRGANVVFYGWTETQVSNVVTAAANLPDVWYKAGQQIKVDHNYQLYAIWAADKNSNGIADLDEGKFNVTYNAGVTNYTGSVPVDNNNYIPKVTVTVSDGSMLKLTDYKLVGWSREPGVHILKTTEEYVNYVGNIIPLGGTFIIEEDTVLYAVWGADFNNNDKPDWMENSQFVIAYDANGGVGKLPSPVILQAGVMKTDIAAEKDVSLKRQNCVLIGFTTNADGAAAQGVVTSAEQINKDAHTVTLNNKTYNYYTFGEEYRFNADHENPVLFYALWAVDNNENGKPDYEDETYNVIYKDTQNVNLSDGYHLPLDGTAYLAQSKVTLSAAKLKGYAGVGSSVKAVTLVGWTKDSQIAGKIYADINDKLPENGILELGSEDVIGAANVTYYAVWATDDFLKGLFTVDAYMVNGAESGTVTPTQQVVAKGQKATVEITPAAGYYLESIAVNNKKADVLPTANADGSYTFTTDALEDYTVIAVNMRTQSFGAEERSYSVEYANSTLEQYLANGLDLVVRSRDNTALTKDQDYTLTIENTDALDAGEYSVKINGKGKYQGLTDEVVLKVTPRTLTADMIKGIDAEYIFTGSQIQPEATVSDTAINLPSVPEANYTVAYGDNVNIGKGTVIVSGNGNYKGSVVMNFAIKALNINDLTDIDVSTPTDFVYNGSAQYGSPTVSYSENGETKKLTVNKDYTLRYYKGEGSDKVPAVPVNAGRYTVTVTGIGSYTGSKEVTYNINPKSIGTAETDIVMSKLGSYAYTGKAVVPVPSVTYQTAGGNVLTLTEGKDFTLTYAAKEGSALTDGKPVDAGQYQVIVTAMAGGNYTDSRTLDFSITAENSGLDVTGLVTKTYKGDAYTAEDLKDDIEVFDVKGSVHNKLVYGTDYELVVENAVNVGTYTVTVKGKGNYAASKGQSAFVIEPAAITEVISGETNLTYNGQAQAPEITSVKAGKLVLGTANYTVTYKDADGNIRTSKPSETGAYTMIVSGKGNFSGSREITFAITAGDLTVAAVENHIYDGLPYQPKPEVKDGERILQENSDYTLIYSGAAVDAGSYTITVKGAGSYADKGGSAGYQIFKKNINNTQPASGTVNVYVSDVTYTGGAVEPAVVVTYQTEDGRTLFLTENRDYTLEYGNNTAVGTAYVKITAVDGSNFEGSRNAEFAINPAYGQTFTVAVDPVSDIYNGREQTPQTIVKSGDATVNADCYQVKYEAVEGTGAELGENNKPLKAGTYLVVVTGKAATNYEGFGGSAIYVITPIELQGITIEPITDQIYDGSAKEPELVVKNGSTELVAGVDYEVRYQNNVNAGTAFVTVIGKGNYAGFINSSFVISPAELTITPVNAEKVYGQKDSVISYNYSGDLAQSAEPRFSGALTREVGEDVGSYNIRLSTLKETSGNYSLKLADNAVFAITPKVIGNGVKPASDIKENLTDGLTVGYTGNAFNGALSLLYKADMGNLALIKSTDYELDFEPENPVDVGEYEVTVNGTGNYEGSFTFKLNIIEAKLGAQFHAAGDDTVVYDGGDWTQGMAGKIDAFFGEEAVTVSDDMLSYKDAQGNDVDEIINAGIYKITLKADNYDPVELTFVVQPKELTADMVSQPQDTVFNGAAVKPEVNVSDQNQYGEIIGENDYSVAYGENTNVGSGSVRVTGKANYKGSVEKTFVINPFEFTADNITVDPVDDVIYNGSAQKQQTTVRADLDGDGVFETKLAENVDCTLTYSGDLVNVTDVGVQISVTGINNYSGALEKAVSYFIKERSLQSEGITAVVNPDKLVYTGKEQYPAVEVYDNDVRLVNGRDYTLEYKNNIQSGTATVKISGIGNYKDERNLEFVIIANTDKLNVAVSPSDKVVYNGRNQRPDLIVKSGDKDVSYEAVYSYNGGTPQSFNLLSQFVDAGVYTITVKGTGNYEGAAGSVNFVILPAEFTVEDISAQDFTGNAIEPKPAVKADGKTLKEGVDYVLSYSDNVAVGENTASVKVTGIGNYSGCVVTKNFTITGENSIFRLNYDGNGNTGGSVPADSNSYYGTHNRATVLDGVPTLENAVFLGWVPDVKPNAVVTTMEDQNSYNTIYRAGAVVVLNKNVTLYALWAKDADNNGRPDYAEQLTITAGAGDGGSIAPDGKTVVNWGGRQEYQIQVSNGYKLSAVTVDGNSVGVSSEEVPTALVKNTDGTYTYTFADVIEDHVILVTFSKNGGGGGGGGGSVEPAPTPEPNRPQWNPDIPQLTTDDHFAYMQGDNEGLFQPNNQISRAEVAAVLARLMCGGMDVPKADTCAFTDVSADAWYYDYVAYLEKYHIINGLGDGTFAPERSISRAEFSAMIMRYFLTDDYTGDPIFTDVDEDYWAYDAINKAHYYGFVQGYTDGTFAPNQSIRRAEAVTIINRVLEREADQKYVNDHIGDLKLYPDVPNTYWAYYDILEASNSHDFKKAGNNVESWTKIR